MFLLNVVKIKKEGLHLGSPLSEALMTDGTMLAAGVVRAVGNVRFMRNVRGVSGKLNA